MVGSERNETLYQKRSFIFSNYEFHLYLEIFQKNLHIEYLIFDMIFRSLCFLSGFYWQCVQLNQWFIDAKFNSSRFMVITDDHGYVPFVVVTIPPFVPRSWLIVRCLSRVTKWVTLVEQELIPIWRTRTDPRFLVGFVLFNL